MSRYETIPLKERFLSKVRKTDGCWEWTGAKGGIDGEILVLRLQI